MDPLKIAIKLITQEFKVYAIYLFGSFASNTQRQDSDLDLAILSDEKIDKIKLWELAQKIAVKIQRDVDLIDLKNASTVFQFQIFNEGKLIFCTDQIKLDFFINTTDALYLDLNEWRKEMIEDIKKSGI
ncbi:MAG: nucleotidyltransferase domain-containing protein [Chlamydiae bacterium]|nr:nucleotidyltransferase domain-containing protein [Chlamydiota bacterium]